MLLSGLNSKAQWLREGLMLTSEYLLYGEVGAWRKVLAGTRQEYLFLGCAMDICVDPKLTFRTYVACTYTHACTHNLSLTMNSSAFIHQPRRPQPFILQAYRLLLLKITDTHVQQITVANLAAGLKCCLHVILQPFSLSHP